MTRSPGAIFSATRLTTLSYQGQRSPMAVGLNRHPCQENREEGAGRLRGDAIADINVLRHQDQALRLGAAVWRALDELTPVALKRIEVRRMRPHFWKQLPRLPVSRSLTPTWASGDRPQTHPAIAVLDVSIMRNRHHASHRISTPRRFRDDSGYTFGYRWPKQEALSLS